MLGKTLRQLRLNLVGTLARFEPVNMTVPCQFFPPLVSRETAIWASRMRS
jgi:hypothetical protein